MGQARARLAAAATPLRAPRSATPRVVDRFRAPPKRGLELVQAAKEAIDARADALLKLQTARSKCEQRRVKLEAALANPAPAPAPGPRTAGGGWRYARLRQWPASSAPPTVEEMQKDSEGGGGAQGGAGTIRRHQGDDEDGTAEGTRRPGDLNAASRPARFSPTSSRYTGRENVMPGCSQVAPLRFRRFPRRRIRIVSCRRRGRR